jgi:hypothetical protein
MASTFSLLHKDDGDPAEGDRLIAAFADKTGLPYEATDDGRIFAIEDSGDHQIDLVQTLDGLDENWPRHLALELPGA